MTIALSTLPKHVSLAVGKHIVIPLPSYADSGNIWSVTCLSGHGIAEVTVELSKTTNSSDSPGDGISEPPSLILVHEQVSVLGLSAGDAVWQLLLSRPFGSMQIAASQNLQITVHAT